MGDVHTRIKQRLAETGKPLRRASLDSGLSQEAISKLLRNPDQSQTLETIQKLAVGLETTPEWLSFGLQLGPAASVVEVPLIDEVTAGKLAKPSSQIPVEKVPLLAFADLGPGEFFATRVSGTSMDRVSPEGSIIIVNRRDQTLVSGKCYVFSVNGETTYKRWQGGDPFYLEPYSTDLIHKPIFIKRKRDLEVVGRVKRTVLDL